VAIDDVPRHLLTGNEFRDLLRATMHVLVSVRELGAELVGRALDVVGLHPEISSLGNLGCHRGKLALQRLGLAAAPALGQGR
jgi:hypothetical protein